MIFDVMTNSIIYGSIPNISGTTQEGEIKQNVMTGLKNVSDAFPAMGSIAGAGMIMGQTKYLSQQNKLEDMDIQKLREMAMILYPFINTNTLKNYSKEKLIKMIKLRKTW